jgi:hypothetical protein
VYQPALTEAFIPFMVADSRLDGAGMRLNGREVKMDKVLTCGIWGGKETYIMPLPGTGTPYGSARAARHQCHSNILVLFGSTGSSEAIKERNLRQR